MRIVNVGQEKMEYSQEVINETLKREEKTYGKWQDYLNNYRENHSSEERVVLMKGWENCSAEEREIYAGVQRRREENPEYQKACRERILRILKHAFHNEMISIFSGKSDKYPELNTISLTEESKIKANKIARRVVEVSRDPNEVYLFLTDLKNKPDIAIRDVYIPHQTASPGGCHLIDQKTPEDREKIKSEGKRVYGWAHSHGAFGTFHSGTDRSNLRFLPSLYGIKKKIALTTFSTEKPYITEIYYIPSLVFNARGAEPAKSIGIEYFDFPISKNDKEAYRPNIFLNEKPRIELIKEENGINVSLEHIDEEIWNKVRSDSGFKDSFNERMLEKYELAESQEEMVRLSRVSSFRDTAVLEKEVVPKQAEIPKKSLDDLVKDERAVKPLEREYKWSMEEYVHFIKEYVLMKEKMRQLEERIKKLEGE